MIRRSLVVGISLALFLAACVDAPEEKPTRVMTIHIDSGRFDSFEANLQSFAQAHDFRYGITPPFKPRGNQLFHLARRDMQIIGNNPFDTGEYDVGFYRARGMKAASKASIDRVYTAFGGSVSKVDGVSVVVSRRAPGRGR